MDRVDRDDFVYALQQTLEGMYNKELNKMQISFWVDACGGKPVDRLKRALREHVKSSKFAPKPADILTLVDNMAKHHGRAELPPPQTTSCPPEIAQAWMWFNRVICAGSNLEGVFGKGERPDPDIEERYLFIVNEQAHIYDTPNAIPDEYRIQEIWG